MEGRVSATVYGLLDRHTNRLRRIDLSDLNVHSGDYYASMSFPDSDAVWRLVRVEALPGLWWRCRSLVGCATQTCTVGFWVSRVHGK